MHSSTAVHVCVWCW